MLRHNRGHAIFFIYGQTIMILHSKLYSVCPSEYQDHLGTVHYLYLGLVPKRSEKHCKIFIYPIFWVGHGVLGIQDLMGI